MVDIGILLNYIFREDLNREIKNINRAAFLFFSLTLLLLLLRYLLNKKRKRI